MGEGLRPLVLEEIGFQKTEEQTIIAEVVGGGLTIRRIITAPSRWLGSKKRNETGD